MSCRHPKSARSTATYCFAGPVAQRENPAAHGGVCERETCGACGASRCKNVNGRHVEQGPWEPAPAWETVAWGARRHPANHCALVAVAWEVGLAPGGWAVREIVGAGAPTLVGLHPTRAAAVADAAARA